MQTDWTRGAQSSGEILAISFGTTVAMWTIGYIGRFPPGLIPGPLILILMLACLVMGGIVVGRSTGRGWRGGGQVGLLASMLNLLILGSLLKDGGSGQVAPSALWWLPGSLLCGALLGSIGGAIGASMRPTGATRENWAVVFASVAAGATFLLLVAGGIVTGAEAGLDVPDWPNSFGSNMFLFPLSRMTGGIYYEHAHRLFGSLVGLTTVVLAWFLWRHDSRRWMRALVVGAVALVIIQGLLGGLRVTGRLTLETDRALLSPQLALAVVHGVLGQVFFSLMVATAAFTSSSWRREEPGVEHESAGTDQGLSLLLVVMVIMQLILGAILRHIGWGLLFHISFAVFVVGVAVICSFRARWIHGDTDILSRLGRWLVPVVVLQVLLGLAALGATHMFKDEGAPSRANVIFTTLHQGGGAVVLATSVLLVLWNRRLLACPLESSRKADS